MEININKLSKEKIMYLNDQVNFDDFKNLRIKKMNPVNFKGSLKYNITDEIEIDLDVWGLMVLEDSNTLEEIDYNFKFKIEEIVTLDEKYLKNNQNTLDINEILWQNIVLEVPIRYTKQEGINLKGNGWELNGLEQSEEKSSAFAKLNDLFKGGE